MPHGLVNAAMSEIPCFNLGHLLGMTWLSVQDGTAVVHSQVLGHRRECCSYLSYDSTHCPDPRISRCCLLIVPAVTCSQLYKSTYSNLVAAC